MSNIIAYTICTASHLAQAKTMVDSLQKHNPAYKIIIGLADRIEGRFDVSGFAQYEIVEVEKLQIPGFATMVQRYTLMELSCALKSFYADHILREYNPDKLIYLDTDLMVFGSLQDTEELLNEKSIIISTHISKPYPMDNKRPEENTILGVGLYNGGYFALRNDASARAFIDWWMHHMKDKCFDAPARGLFVDQNWLNFVPLFFSNVHVIQHDGYNVAYWNMHERDIEEQGAFFVVNKSYPLVFFHFSGYSYKNPSEIARHQDRFLMASLPAYRKIFTAFHEALIKNRHPEFLQIPCVYAKPKGIKKVFKKIGL